MIDNGSRDGTVEHIEERFGGQFRLARNPSNEGFWRTHNTAIPVSNGRYVLTLIPDVVLAPTFLERAVEAISAEPRIGSVNGKLLQGDSEGFENGKFAVPDD